MKKLLGIILSLTLIVPSFNIAVSANDSNTETISYNYAYDFENGYDKQENRTRQMEKLNRGLVAIRTDNGVYLSWRLLDSEDNIYGSAQKNVSFNVYRNNTKIATVTKTTCYTDTEAGTNYSVAPVVNGNEGEKCAAVSVQDNSYFDIPLDRPAPQHLPKVVSYKMPNESKATNHFTNSDSDTLTDENIIGSWRDESAVWTDYSYSIGDCSTGDVDGDGEYEIIVKWDCNAQDNSLSGVTGNVYLDAYKQNGTKLWRVNLGKNIRAGAHYTQFLVYDFDGDGKSEVICRTAPGSMDSKDNYVTSASHLDEIKNISNEINETDYRNDGGYILSGDEYLTVFNGFTGEAIDTIYYPNQRVDASVWGDRYGNRCDRFTADVAYMDDEKPYAVYMRGYYMRQNGGIGERQTACAVSFNGSTLDCKYSFDTYDVNTYRYKSTSPSYREDGTYKGVQGYESGYEIYVGEGNHNCTVADVNNDGKDEVITGALCYWVDPESDTLKPKWCTFMEHGDALHIGDYDPIHEGLEFFTVHEDSGPNTKSGQSVEINFGMSVIDPNTGNIIKHWTASKDTGRGIMANVGAGGYYQVNAGNQVTAHIANGGDDFTDMGYNPFSNNFRIFWDGDLYDELLNGTDTASWNGSRMASIFNASRYNCMAVNGTKANPALQADLFGDWREELIYPVTSNDALRVFSTTTPTDYKIKTLMQDPVYRSGVAAEQTAYNQPPHVGFYMGAEVFTPSVEKIEITSLPSKLVYSEGESLNTEGLVVKATYTDGTVDDNLSSSLYQISGYDPTVIGTQTVTISCKGTSAVFEVTVKSADISNINGIYSTSSTDSVSSEIKIGTFTGNFAIEHDVTINSMPANGSTDRNSTSGFFVRFTPTNNAVGAGWYLTQNGDGKANVIWKWTSTKTIAAINIGETYTFKYSFKNVGDGTGARVDLTITDSTGNIIGSAENLDLRNMTSNNNKPETLTYPLASIQIYNQASTNSTASVTIENAHKSCISSVDISNNTVTVNVPSGASVYAAQYDGSEILTRLAELTVDAANTEVTLPIGFTPDKIFVWNQNMRPIDFWTK